MKLNFSYQFAKNFISDEEIKQIKPYVELANEVLTSKSGAGNDFLGWLTLPEDYDKEEFARIKKAAEKIKSDSEVLIVIGIGGSYLGAKAAIEFLSHSFYNNLPKEKRKGPEIYFAGTNMSGVYLNHLIDLVGDRDFSVNVISKSGTTTEPAIAFRVFKKMLEEKYGKEEAVASVFNAPFALSVVAYILFPASSLSYLSSSIFLNTLNAIAGSVVVPDFEITFTEKSLSPTKSIR